MKVVSLYSGADNLGDGVIQAGHEIILAVEMDSDCCKTIKLNHPDIEVINGKVSDHLESLPRCDAVVGGPPCPEFSRANTERTFDMCEVNNFQDAVKITKSKYWFMENVQDLKKKLIKGNHLINTADYGVPQTRLRRIFTNLSLPTPTHAEKPQQNLFGEQQKKWVSVKEALNLNDDFILEDRKTVFGEYPSDENNAEFRKYDINEPSRVVVTDSRLFISKTGFNGCNQIEKTKSVNEPAPTVMATEQMQLTNYKIYSVKYLREKNPAVFQKHKINELDRPASTILAKDRGFQGEEMIQDDNKKWARKLTNQELAILQGFRPDFQFYGSKVSVRKQIGNALPAAVSKAFFSQENL